MNSQAIIIRAAREVDIPDIWSLLHADSKTWSDDQIRQQLGHLYVMADSQKLIGVLYGSFRPEKNTIIWVAIHPMYPEKPLRVAMSQALSGTVNTVITENRPKTETKGMDDFRCAGVQPCG